MEDSSVRISLLLDIVRYFENRAPMRVKTRKCEWFIDLNETDIHVSSVHSNSHENSLV